MLDVDGWKHQFNAKNTYSYRTYVQERNMNLRSTSCMAEYKEKKRKIDMRANKKKTWKKEKRQDRSP